VVSVCSCVPATTLDSRDESPKGFVQQSLTALSAFLRKTPGEALREYFDRPEIGLPPTPSSWAALSTRG